MTTHPTPAPRTAADILDKASGVVRYVESWVNVLEGDPFLDDLRDIRDFIEAQAAPDAALLDVERLAVDLYNAVAMPETIWWDDLSEEMHEDWRRGARAILARLAEQPKEPTDD